ncbi:MAG: site-specific integrase [Planctomycetota bacterium]
MPKPKSSHPKLREHKASSRAYVVLNGRTIYLGKHNDPKAHTDYWALIAKWEASGRSLEGVATAADDAAGGAYTFAHLIRDFMEHARDYYGECGEAASYKSVCRLLRVFHEREPVASFGPLKLRTLREHMVAGDWYYTRRGAVVKAQPWNRTNANAQTNRIKRMFKWAVGREIIDANTLHALQAVEALRAGKTKAKPPRKVGPVSEAMVNDVLPHLSRQVAALVRVMWLTGMRPSEACAMRPLEIDATGDVWLYKPSQHKTEHHGIARVIPIGPQCVEVLKPFMDRDAGAFMFSPIEAERERRAALTAARVTPASCGNRPGTNRREKPNRTPGEKYDASSLLKAVTRACANAYPLPKGIWSNSAEGKAWRKQHAFTPYQLRHAAATRTRQATGGLEAVQVMLGHRNQSTTEVYAEPDLKAAVEAARRFG